MVELNRWLEKPPDAAEVDAATVARVQLIAERAGLRRLDLVFSDAATVFRSDKPVFHGDDSYLFLQRRDGLIGLDQATVHLPLGTGANDLSILVTDHLGGWGLMAQVPDIDGLRVRPASPQDRLVSRQSKGGGSERALLAARARCVTCVVCRIAAAGMAQAAAQAPAIDSAREFLASLVSTSGPKTMRR